MKQDLEVVHCRSCGAPMVFGRTEKGRNMPLDVEAVEGGEWDIDEDGMVMEAPNEMGHRAHHFTCPDGKTYRRTHKRTQKQKM